MAHIHGVSVNITGTDKPIHTVSDKTPGVVWLSPCSGVNMFMPDDAEKAAAYLENLAKEIAYLRLYYSTKLMPVQE